MDHGVEGAQVRRHKIPDVLVDRWNRQRIGRDRAVVEVAGIEPHDVVAALDEKRRHDRAEVAAVTGHKDRAADEGRTHPATAVRPSDWRPSSRSACASSGSLSVTSPNGQPAASAACPFALVVAEERRPGEIEVMVALGLEEHPRRRLAAGATLVPPVRAVVDAVDPAARGLGLAAQTAMHRRQVVHRHPAAGDAGLVRHHEHPPSGPVEGGERLAGARQPAEVRRPADVLRPWRAHVEHPVAVEDDRRRAGEEGLGQRQAFVTADAVVTVLAPVGVEFAARGQGRVDRLLEQLLVVRQERQHRRLVQDRVADLDSAEPRGRPSAVEDRNEAVTAYDHAVPRVAVRVRVDGDLRRRARLHVRPPHAIELHRPVVIAVQQQEPVVELIGRVAHSIGGQIVRVRYPVADLDSVVRAVAEVVDHRVGHVAEQQQNAVQTLLAEHLNDVAEERLAVERDQGLGQSVRQRRQTGAPPAGQNHGLGGSRVHRWIDLWRPRRRAEPARRETTNHGGRPSLLVVSGRRP